MNLGLVLGAIVLLLLIGLALTVIAIRGKLIHRGPHCRACRFDLAGVQGRCPECGAVLDSPRAVREGLRKTRPRLLALGAVLSLCSISAGGALAWGRAKGFNWNTLKPSWLLIRELNTTSPSTSNAAMSELYSRLSSNSLAPDRATRIMLFALDRQPDPNATWAVSWSDFLETCRVRGMMSPEQVLSYAKSAASTSVESRPRIAVGDNLVVRVRVAANRIGQSSKLRLTVQQFETVVAGRVVSKGGGGGSLGLGIGGSGTIGSQFKVPGPPGAHTLTTTWKFGMTDGASEAPIATWEQSFEVPFDALPEGTPTVTVVNDDSFRAAIESSLTVTQCEVGSLSGDQRYVNGMINLQGTPVGLAYDVFWAAPDGSKQWKVGQVSFPANSGGAGYGLGGFVPADFNLPEVDVILRPSVRAATETTNIFEIWGGEIRRRGVPVKLSLPSSK